MKRHTRILLISGLLGVTVVANAAMPTGAYLRKPVSSVAGLINQVKTDPIVADRYIRHFRMSKEQIIAYFGTLHMSGLDHAGAYTVYNVHDSVLKSRVLQLKKGAVVFADNTGRPILLKICGNPMIWNVPAIGTSPTVGSSATGEVPGDSEDAAAVAMIAPTVVPGVMDVPPPPRVDVPPVTASRGRDSLLPLLAILGGAAFLIKDDNNDCPPVPEPTTMLALASGVALMARRRKKNQS